jgi:hypothetical protein
MARLSDPGRDASDRKTVGADLWPFIRRQPDFSRHNAHFRGKIERDQGAVCAVPWSLRIGGERGDPAPGRVPFQIVLFSSD